MAPEHTPDCVEVGRPTKAMLAVVAGLTVSERLVVCPSSDAVNVAADSVFSTRT